MQGTCLFLVIAIPIYFIFSLNTNLCRSVPGMRVLFELGVVQSQSGVFRRSINGRTI
jgi:hypothetical protein